MILSVLTLRRATFARGGIDDLDLKIEQSGTVRYEVAGVDLDALK
jgi:hypothetical protein